MYAWICSCVWFYRKYFFCTLFIFSIENIFAVCMLGYARVFGACMHTHTHANTHIHTHTHDCGGDPLHRRFAVCMCKHVCVRAFVCTCTHANTHTHTHTNAQAPQVTKFAVRLARNSFCMHFCFVTKYSSSIHYFFYICIETSGHQICKQNIFLLCIFFSMYGNLRSPNL